MPLLSVRIPKTHAVVPATSPLEVIDDAIWNVLEYQALLGRFRERTRTVTVTGAASLKNDR
ncbi:hypothetical protein [Gemmatimonas sp.]|uniref:hypothetical protein n=1 Tax=Gemmatimonas sp. TaxID=1962908 RepID=UPI0033406454